MDRVSQTEFNVLSVAEALFGFSEPNSVSALLGTKHKVSTYFGPTAARILQDMVGKGIVLSLLNWGGHKRVKRIYEDTVTVSRLWEQRAPALHCTANVVKILWWLVAEPFADKKEAADLHLEHTTVGDSIVLSRALDLLRANKNVYLSSAHINDALCWFMHHDLLYKTGAPQGLQTSVSQLFDAHQLFSSVQDELARRWRAVELEKTKIRDPELMTVLGNVQNYLLSSTIDYAKAHNRPDFVWFIFKVLSNWINSTTTAVNIILDPETTLASRQAGYIGACAVLSALAPLYAWTDEAKTTRFFDDKYAVDQVLVHYWETMIKNDGLAQVNELIATVTKTLGDAHEQRPASVT